MNMPAKNVIKTYVKDGYYHVYNRGVEKRKIFLDDQDFKVFLNILKASLNPPQKGVTLYKGDTLQSIPKQPKNFYGQIELLAYCLMPNHFHFLLKQNSDVAMKQFMQSIATRYSMYFNKKYKRIGALFQNAYKAILITEEPYLLHLSRYIHLNPSEYTVDMVNTYSSYGEYIGVRHTSWIKLDIILSFFHNDNKIAFIGLKKVNTYKNFIEQYLKDSEKSDILDSSVTLEEAP